MSRLLFEGHEYSYKSLFELYKISPKYKEGEVVDLEDGEVFDLSEIKNNSSKYLSEVLNNIQKNNILDKLDAGYNKKILEEKYISNTITKDELLILIELKGKTDFTKIKYDKFFIVNMSKLKPDTLSFIDMGRFYEMVKFMSYGNVLEKNNGKSIKLQELSKILDFNNSRSCSNYLSKLKKNKLIADISIGGIKFLAINPAYAQRNMKVNRDIFKLFQDDLKDFFSEIEIKFLLMEDDGIEIDSLVHIE